MRIELADTTRTLVDEIQNGAPQRSVAMTYALAIRSSDKTDWCVVNQAILTRWKLSGLERIKRMAWSGSCFGEQADD